MVVIAEHDPSRLRQLCARLSQTPGRDRASVLGRYPRFKVVPASSWDEALAKITPEVSAVALDMRLADHGGVEVIRDLRLRRGDLAVLASTGAVPASQAVAALMAGADQFHEYTDLESFEHAVDLAIDRRRLTRLIEQNEAEAMDARQRLERLHGGLHALAGFRPPQAREAVLPFQDAARRYLLAASALFDGDPQGLAARLGVSYFALRRLLKRYDVPFPGRTRTKPAKARPRARPKT